MPDERRRMLEEQPTQYINRRCTAAAHSLVEGKNLMERAFALVRGLVWYLTNGEVKEHCDQAHALTQQAFAQFRNALELLAEGDG